MDEIKYFYTDLINTLVKDDKEKLHVFDENGLYLATKKIGKNNPKAEQIQTDTVCAGIAKLTGQLLAAWQKRR